MITSSPLSVAEAVLQMYTDTKAQPPTIAKPIAPLTELVSNYPLRCTELPNLTGNKALQHMRQKGLSQVLSRGNNEPLAGFLYANSSLGHMFIEQNDIVVRRRFSIAHELGHYLLHFRPRLNAVPENEMVEMTEAQKPPLKNAADDTTTGYISYTRAGNSIATIPNDSTLEQEANRFAVEVLMPLDVLRGLMARYGLWLRGDDLIWRLANDTFVSIKTMQYRLKSLRLLEAGRGAQEGERDEL